MAPKTPEELLGDFFAASVSRARKTVTASALASAGKLAPKQGFGASGVADLTELSDETQKDIALFIPITKVNEELREVTGIVLQPEVVDGQGDIMSEAVIAKAAGDFLAGYNSSTKLGYMHKEFDKNFELRQSFIAPLDIVIANKKVRQGSWVMVVRVLDSKVWKAVKDGKITGFSIGGKAKKLKAPQ